MKKLPVLITAVLAMNTARSQETGPFLNPDAYIVTVRVTNDDTQFTIPVHQNSYRETYDYTVSWKPKGTDEITGTKTGQTAECIVNFGA